MAGPICCQKQNWAAKAAKCVTTILPSLADVAISDGRCE